MSVQWYFSHGGMTHGPFTDAEIKEQVSRKKVLENDLVWQGSREPRNPAPAASMLDFSPPAAAVPGLPDWLSDVAPLPTKAPVPVAAPTNELPRLLEDMRLWYGLELLAAVKSCLTPENEGRTGATPDWLTTWVAPAQPITTAKPVITAQPIITAQLLVTAQPIITATPIVTAQPIVGAPSVHVAQPKTIDPAPPVARVSSPPNTSVSVSPTQAVSTPAPALSPTNLRSVPPVQYFSGPTKQTPSAEDDVVKKALQETGFDPRTGQILDAEKFRTWQRSAHTGQPAVSNGSVFEVFRKARIAVENWVDEDSRQPLVLAGDLSAIKKDVHLVAIFRQYQGYGAAMQEKLAHHLEFMVENRRKYYAARSRRGDADR